MAAPGGNFFIQERLGAVAPHHESYSQLWETKWKDPVSSSIEWTLDAVSLILPIVHQGTIPVHVRQREGFRADSRQAGKGRDDRPRSGSCRSLRQSLQGGYKEPYDWDDYAQQYFPKAEELVAEAEKAEKEGNKEKACELYL